MVLLCEKIYTLCKNQKSQCDLGMMAKNSEILEFKIIFLVCQPTFGNIRGFSLLSNNFLE